MADTGPIKINLSQVLASKMGKKARYIPRFLVKAIERLICQNELNTLLEHNYPKRGTEFAEGLLQEMDVHLAVHGSEHMPANRRCIIVSNHPLGGFDGIAMIAWLSRHYGGCPVHFVVNDILMVVEPLSDCFVPINKHGAQSRSSATNIDTILAGDDPVVIYPAGLVSRLGDDGVIADLTWRKMVITKAISSQRDVVPVHFGGQNRPSFYRWARLRKKLGIKFNFEMVLLPREFVRCHGKTFTLTIGEPIPWHTFKGGAAAAAEASRLRNIVYSLPHDYKTT